MKDLNGARGVHDSSSSDSSDWHAPNRRIKITPKKRPKPPEHDEQEVKKRSKEPKDDTQEVKKRSKEPKDDTKEVKAVHKKKKKRLTVRAKKGKSLISLIVYT